MTEETQTDKTNNTQNGGLKECIENKSAPCLAGLSTNQFLDIQDLEILILTIITGEPVNAPKTDGFHSLYLSDKSLLKHSGFFLEWNRQRHEELGFSGPGPIYSTTDLKAYLASNMDDITAFLNNYLDAYAAGKLEAEHNEWYSFKKSYAEVLRDLKKAEDIAGFRISYVKDSKVRVYEILMYMRQQGFIEIADARFIEKHSPWDINRLSFRPRLLVPISTMEECPVPCTRYMEFKIYTNGKVLYKNKEIINIKETTRESRFLKLLIQAKGEHISISNYTDRLLDGKEPTAKVPKDYNEKLLGRFKLLGRGIERKLKKLGITDIDIKTNTTGCYLENK